jgi:CubicO group peptidase (beta-lactamase class C family)
MPRHLPLLVVLILCSALPAAAKDVVLAPGTAAEVGIEQSVLDSAVEIYREAVERDAVRGAVLLVARNGKIVLHEALGWQDKDRGIPMPKNAMFRMASNTKPVVATAIGILVEEEKLDWNDRVGKHIAAFDNTRAGLIEIGHLLSHTSGLRIKPIFFAPLRSKSPEHPDAPNLRLEVERFGKVGPAEPVGASYSYNNAGYNTLGALIEIVSDKPLDVFLKQRIYDPLGMTDTYHQEVAERLDGKLDRMCVVYYKRDGEWTVGWKPGDPPQYPFVRASGGMISTADDYAVFCQMYLNGGVYAGKRILEEATIRRMLSRHADVTDSPDDSASADSYYGFGWRIFAEGVFSHSGSDGTAAWVDPKNDLIVLAFTQSPGEKGLGRRFFTRVRESIGP